MLALLLLPAALAPAWGQTTPAGEVRLDEPPAAIAGMRLRKGDDRQHVHFLMEGTTPVSVVGNPRHQVVVVKFQHARAAFPQGQRIFAFNDPFIEGIVFDEVAPNVTWAKIRLRDPHIAFAQSDKAPPGQVVISFWRPPARKGPVITNFTLTPQPVATRLTLDVSRLPEYEARREGNFFLVRLKDTAADMAHKFSGGDNRVQLVAMDEEGNDLLVRIQFKQADLQAVASTNATPPRLEFSFTPAPKEAMVTAPPAPEPSVAPKEVPGAPPRPAPRGESLDELLAGEPSPVVRSNYLLGEREFRAGDYGAANGVFLRVYQASPRSRLGIRSLFRAADAQYAIVLRAKGVNYHQIIENYQAAVRAAEAINYESELIPEAFFQIGRSYQQMGFDFEANISYQILQERFPDNTHYTPDSYFYRGQTYLGLRKFDEAIGAFKSFLEREGDPALAAPAYYQLGDTLYNQQRYPDAKAALDKGREIDQAYPDSRPLLLFHMGETYYENAEFDVARVLYRKLLEKFPEKPYTKLVALRLGDFLRDEGKEADALEIYGMVAKDGSLEIRLRGKMRIANLLAERPSGEDYKTAVRLYDEVIQEAQRAPIAEEAQLRKALALTLHNRHVEAIAAFEALAKEFPKSPYVRPNIVAANIDENLKALIDAHYTAKEYWEIAKVYTRYRDQYFPNFKFQFTLFEVADAYQHLGLYEDAIRLYQRILDGNPGEVRTLVEYRRDVAFADKDDLVRAEESLLRFIQEHPNDIYVTDARIKLGNVYLGGRRYADALNAFRILERDFLQNKDPRLNEAASEVYYSLGVIYKELGQIKDSADAFQSAIDNFHHPIQGDKVPPSIILSHFLKGDALFELEQDQDAIAAYEKAIKLYPNHAKAPWARYQIGLIYRRNGDDRKALESFNALVDLARTRPGELWEPLARENQRDLVNELQYKDYLTQ